MRETSYHAVIAEMTVRALWELQNLLDCIPRRAVGPLLRRRTTVAARLPHPARAGPVVHQPAGHRLCRAAHPHAALAGTAHLPGSAS